MSTERQQNASRTNGSKSRGPVTPEGKLASSQNAMTHGLLSATIVLQGESTDRFEKLIAALYEEFQPETPFEESLIENMAVARWRQRRIWGMEKAGMDHEVRRQAGLSSSNSADIFHADNATRASLAFRTLSDDSRSLELINRYDSRYERQYYRAHRRFLEVRDRRTPPQFGPANLRRRDPSSDDGTFPTGGIQSDAGATIHEMPAPATSAPPAVTPVEEKSEISKGTREVIENKPVHSGSKRQLSVSIRLTGPLYGGLSLDPWLKVVFPWLPGERRQKALGRGQLLPALAA